MGKHALRKARRCALPLLYDQKWAAQRAVQDREAQHKTVEAILAEAALANAQLAVAKAVMQAEFRREGASAEEAAAKAEEAVEKMATQLVFGRVPLQRKANRQRGQPKVSVMYFRNILESVHGNSTGDNMVLPPADQPVQLAMFDL